MIFLTGAAGKTGRTLIKKLLDRKAEVRALAKNTEQASLLTDLGVKETVIGDLHDVNALQEGAAKADAVYFICPNMMPDELEVGKKMISAAGTAGVKRFVYHSVMHPQVEAMPHHWQKMRVEEALFESGLDFTILQPCAYMQNIQASLNTVLESGIYFVPYNTSARISIVDLEDVAEVAATVLTGDGYSNSIFELSGPAPLSQDEVASIIEKATNKKVQARLLDRNQWELDARKNIHLEYQIQTLLKMFEYYEKFDFIGNPYQLEHLLGRHATSFEVSLRKMLVQLNK